MDKLVIAKIGKGNNSINICERVVLHFAVTLMTVYQYIKFHSFIFNTFRAMLQTNLLLHKLRRQITIITCERVMVLALGTSSNDILSMYQVLFNFLLYFQRYARDKLNIAKIRRGSNSVSTKVMVTAFCNSPHSLLSVYQVPFQYIQYFKRCTPDKLIIAKLEGK